MNTSPVHQKNSEGADSLSVQWNLRFQLINSAWIQ